MPLRLTLSLLPLLLTSVALAQTPRLSEKPEQFITDVQTALGNARVGTDFAAAWNGGKFSPAQQTALIALSRTMAGKGYRAQPHLALLFDAINRASEQAQPLDSLLAASQKFLASTDTKTGQRYLETLRNLFGSRLLYTSNTNRVYATGGTLGFRFSTEPFSPYLPAADTAQTKASQQAAAAIDDDGWGFDEKAAKADDGWGDSPLGTFTNAAGWEEPLPTLAAGALLDLKNVTLALVTASDSLVVAGVTATVGFKESLLLGNAGQVTWPATVSADSLLPATEASIALARYRVDLKNPRLLASEATLTAPALLTAPVKGAYEFLSKKRPPRAPWSYPRFLSAGADAKFKTLGTDLDYQGGVALIGPKVYAVAVGAQPAVFSVKNSGKPVFRTSGRRFELGDSLLRSEGASLTAFLSTGDTLTHPALKLRYDRARKELHGNRVSKGGFRAAPFTDPYHAVTINADAFNWPLNSQRMDFYTVSARNEVPVRIESFDFFNRTRYTNLSGSYGFHPLTALAAYFRQKGGKQEVVVSDLGPFFKRPDANIREAMMEMVQQGYLTYDPALDLLRFSKKGRHYVQSFAGKEDYDTFIILSTFSNSMKDSLSNVTLNLPDNQLIIRGAERFQVSDSLKIFIAPSDKQVKMGKNRNFTFDGEMKLDNYRFAGKNLSFNYDEFFVKLDKVDSVTFVSQKDKGKSGAQEIGGDLQYGSGGGTVFLGKKGNKSGKAPNIPRLVVPGGAKIYFDQPDRAAGVYHRKIYFQIPNLDYDSLTSRDIRLEGMFYSDGILPPFKASLVTMPDNSLGFNYKNTTIALFGGAASVKLTGPLKMDKQGLHAAGELLLNGATLPSKNIRFYPDSVVASGAGGSIAAGGKANLPAVALKKYDLAWKPKRDSLLLADQGDGFDFYNASTKLNGNLVLRSTGLYGEGLVKRKDSQTTSGKFLFNKDAFSAEEAEVRIGANVASGGAPVLLGTGMNVNFNALNGNAVLVKPKRDGFEQDSSGLEFPYAAYRTTITRAEYNGAAKLISMKGDVKTSAFISTAPDQEGLRFNASEGSYDVEKMTLTVRGVPFIKSADARITPAKGQLVIKQDAALQPLVNARLTLDTLNGYHSLANGSIRILSRSKFEGDATYLLVKNPGDTVRLKMNAFEMQGGGPELTASTGRGKRERNAATPAGGRGVVTTAAASVNETDKFFLTPRIQYRGEVTMRSPEKKLGFNGALRLNLKSRPNETAWIDFNNAESDDVNIRVDDKLRGDGLPLYAGLHFRSASSGLYTTFVSPKENPADSDILLATGPLVDGGKTNTLTVEPDAKTEGKTLEGNRFVLDDARKVVNLEGKFNLVQPAAYAQAGGLARLHPDSGKYQFNLLLALDFPLPAPVLTTMGDKLVQTNLDEKNNDPAEPDNDRLLLKLAHVAGGKAADAYRDKAAGGYLPLPTTVASLNKSLVLSAVSLRWSEEQSAFYSVGKLGVSNVGGVDINASLEGHLEIRKNPGAGDDVFVYLEASPEVWYYWGFRQNQLGLVSSDGDFNNALTAQTKTKTKGDFSFSPVGEDEKVLFVERFEQTYVPRSKTKPAPRPAKPAAPVAKTEEPEKVDATPTEVAAEPPAVKAPTPTPKVAAKKGAAKKAPVTVPTPKKVEIADSLAKAGVVLTDSLAKTEMRMDSTGKKGIVSDSTSKTGVAKKAVDEAEPELAPVKKVEKKKTGF